MKFLGNFKIFCDNGFIIKLDDKNEFLKQNIIIESILIKKYGKYDHPIRYN